MLAILCRVAGLLCAGAFALPAADSPQPAKPAPGIGRVSRSDPSEEIFTNGVVLTLSVEIAESELNKLRKDNRSYVRCTVKEDGTAYPDVGVHLKGAAGSFRGLDDRPALTLNFDKFREHQRFHGLDKIHLNNSVQDPSYLAEYICGELFRAAGVPASRVTHARVDLNGRNLGLYVVKEGFDKTFLSRYFKNTKGNLYDGGFLKEINDGLQKNSGDDSKDQKDLRALAEAAREPEPAKRIARLAERLDLERFISFIAMELMVWHWDGYAMKRNNYRIYHDLDTDRIVFFPHGMDQMFWEPNGPILPPNLEGLVARALVQTPEGRRRYRERMSALLTNVFKVEILTNKVMTVAARLRPTLAEMSRDAARGLDWHARVLCERITQRAVSMERQLTLPEPGPLRFDPAGVARLDGWQPQEFSGNANLEKTRSADGRNTLRITAHGPSNASWRTPVVLDAGRYQLVAQARTAGILPIRDQRGAGAGLRISGSQQARSNKLSGTADWTRLEYVFDVPNSGMEIVLVCELRATKGDVWFDLDSLRLVRRKN